MGYLSPWMVMEKVVKFNGLDVVALAMDRKVFKPLMKKKNEKCMDFHYFHSTTWQFYFIWIVFLIEIL
jgi:hypothetical protein